MTYSLSLKIDCIICLSYHKGMELTFCPFTSEEKDVFPAITRSVWQNSWLNLCVCSVIVWRRFPWGGVDWHVLVDDDLVCLTNLNRQIIATRKTVGKYKADVMEDLSVLQLCTRNDASDFPEAYSSAIPVRSRLRTSWKQLKPRMIPALFHTKTSGFLTAACSWFDLNSGILQAVWR